MLNRIEEHLEKLMYFKVVCDQRSIGKAARVLLISQPALSRALKRLEKYLDKKLIHRTPKGVIPTKDGLILLDFARQVSLESSILSEWTGSSKRSIRIGTHHVFKTHYLDNFVKNFPLTARIGIHIKVGRIDNLIDSVRKLKLDAALTVRPVDTAGLNVEVIKSGRMKFFGPEKSNDQMQVFTDLGAHFSQFQSIPGTLASRGLSNIFSGGLYSFDEAKKIAESGRGIAALPENMVENGSKLCEIDLLPHVPLTYEVCLVSRTDSDVPGLSNLKEFLGIA